MQEQVAAWFQGVQEDLAHWKPLRGSSLADQAFGGLISGRRWEGTSSSSDATPNGTVNSARPNPFDSKATAKGAGRGLPPGSSSLRGVVWVDGSGLPPPPVLAPAVEAALTATLARVSAASPPELRVHGGSVESATSMSSGFHFEVRVASGSLLPLVECLKAEAACRGAERLLPELVALLEEKAPAFGHCRVRLELQEEATLPMGPPTMEPVSPAAAEVQKPRGSPSPATLLAGGPSPKDLRRAGGSPAGPASDRTPSPTAGNLARDPALKARVMQGAIPLMSPDGRRLSGLGRTSSCGEDEFGTLDTQPSARRSDTRRWL